MVVKWEWSTGAPLTVTADVLMGTWRPVVRLSRTAWEFLPSSVFLGNGNLSSFSALAASEASRA